MALSVMKPTCNIFCIHRKGKRWKDIMIPQRSNTTNNKKILFVLRLCRERHRQKRAATGLISTASSRGQGRSDWRVYSVFRAPMVPNDVIPSSFCTCAGLSRPLAASEPATRTRSLLADFGATTVAALRSLFCAKNLSLYGRTLTTCFASFFLPISHFLSFILLRPP